MFIIEIPLMKQFLNLVSLNQWFIEGTVYIYKKIHKVTKIIFKWMVIAWVFTP